MGKYMKVTQKVLSWTLSLSMVAAMLPPGVAVADEPVTHQFQVAFKEDQNKTWDTTDDDAKVLYWNDAKEISEESLRAWDWYDVDSGDEIFFYFDSADNVEEEPIITLTESEDGNRTIYTNNVNLVLDVEPDLDPDYVKDFYSVVEYYYFDRTLSISEAPDSDFRIEVSWTEDEYRASHFSYDGETQFQIEADQRCLYIDTWDEFDTYEKEYIAEYNLPETEESCEPPTVDAFRYNYDFDDWFTPGAEEDFVITFRPFDGFVYSVNIGTRSFYSDGTEAASYEDGEVIAVQDEDGYFEPVRFAMSEENGFTINDDGSVSYKLRPEDIYSFYHENDDVTGKTSVHYNKNDAGTPEDPSDDTYVNGSISISQWVESGGRVEVFYDWSGPGEEHNSNVIDCNAEDPDFPEIYPGNGWDTEFGKALEWMLIVPEDYAGETPIVEVRVHAGDGNEEVYLSTDDPDIVKVSGTSEENVFDFEYMVDHINDFSVNIFWSEEAYEFAKFSFDPLSQFQLEVDREGLYYTTYDWEEGAEEPVERVVEMGSLEFPEVESEDQQLTPEKMKSWKYNYSVDTYFGEEGAEDFVLKLIPEPGFYVRGLQIGRRSFSLEGDRLIDYDEGSYWKDPETGEYYEYALSPENGFVFNDDGSVEYKFNEEDTRWFDEFNNQITYDLNDNDTPENPDDDLYYRDSLYISASFSEYPGYRVEYDARDYDPGRITPAKITLDDEDETVVDHGIDYNLAPGETLNLLITPPSDCEDAPIASVRRWDNEFYDSIENSDVVSIEETDTEGIYRFSYTNDSYEGFEVRIYWNEDEYRYDSFGYDEFDQYQVCYDYYVDEVAVVDFADIPDDQIANNVGYKYNFSVSSLDYDDNYVSFEPVNGYSITGITIGNNKFVTEMPEDAESFREHLVLIGSEEALDLGFNATVVNGEITYAYYAFTRDNTLRRDFDGEPEMRWDDDADADMPVYDSIRINVDAHEKEEVFTVTIGDKLVYTADRGDGQSEITVPEGAEYEIYERGEFGIMIFFPVTEEGKRFELEPITTTGYGRVEINLGWDTEAHEGGEQTDAKSAEYLRILSNEDGFSLYSAGNNQGVEFWITGGDRYTELQIDGMVYALSCRIDSIARVHVGTEEHFLENAFIGKYYEGDRNLDRQFSFADGIMDIYSYVPFMNIGQVCSVHGSYVFMTTMPTDNVINYFVNVSDVVIREGGGLIGSNFEEDQSSFSFDGIKFYSEWYTDEGEIIDISGNPDARIEDCLQVTECEPSEDYDESHADSDGRYIFWVANDGFTLQSTTLPLHSMAYSFNPNSGDKYVANGKLEIRAGSGIGFSDENGGEYWFEEDTVVEIRLVPNQGYKYTEDSLCVNGNPDSELLTATETPGVYKLTMPDGPLHISCAFTEGENEINTKDTETVSGAEIKLADNTVDGLVEFTVKDTDLTPDDIAKMDEAAENFEYEVIAGLDLSLDNVIEKIGTDGETWVTGLSELSNEMDVSLEFADELKEGDYVLFRLHETEGGTVTEVLEAEVEDNAVSFKTDKYSTYVLAWMAPTESPVVRIAGDSRYDTSIESAERLKKVLGVEKFDNIVIASGLTYADALPGSYLAAKKNAPIILTANSNKVIAQTVEYVTANLAEGGVAYILGGEGAVPAAVEDQLRNAGISVERLAGDNRYETNIEILKAAEVAEGEDIIVCTGLAFADSLSASATGKAILMVPTNRLLDSQKEFLDDLTGEHDFYIVGGTGAVTDDVANALASYGDVERVAGTDRFETSVAIATKFFDKPKSVVLAYAANFPDGLSAGTLAYATGSPLILTQTSVKHPEVLDAAVNYVKGNEQKLRKLYVMGGSALISDEDVEKIYDASLPPV
ncbi:MAG: cell wall-binding repeat-containing protein [Lachnospiraceae bacterium]|nr:cell wall-binding repeat-containing protein [Lachnospiraceae bacterium]